MRKILILNGQYLPGYKGGGPIRSIQNIVENLQDEYKFYILTSDRDFKDKNQYTNIEVNKWIDVDNYKVYYMTPDRQNLKWFKKIINNIDYDIMYLNGFFSPIFTIKPLILRKIRMLKNKNVILCARGDFSEGHLQIKKLKKMSYIYLVKLIRLYKGVVWHATSNLELNDLKRVFCRLDYIYAPNLSSKPANYIERDTYIKRQKKINLIFLSRICEKKNLIYALQLLNDLDDSIEVKFDIYGPKENIEYWDKCQEVIKYLPSNIKVNYLGEVIPSKISEVFRKYDAFLFPTLGENYGHVIVESISNGCIPIISDQTPWRNLEERKMGFDINLKERNIYINAIKKIADMSYDEIAVYKNNNINFYNNNIINNDDINLNKKMFDGDQKYYEKI